MNHLHALQNEATQWTHLMTYCAGRLHPRFPINLHREGFTGSVSGKNTGQLNFVKMYITAILSGTRKPGVRLPGSDKFISEYNFKTLLIFDLMIKANQILQGCQQKRRQTRDDGDFIGRLERWTLTWWSRRNTAPGVFQRSSARCRSDPSPWRLPAPPPPGAGRTSLKHTETSLKHAA